MIENYEDEDFFEIFKKRIHLQILCERLKLRGCDRSKIPDFFSSEFWRLSLFFEKTATKKNVTLKLGEIFLVSRGEENSVVVCRQVANLTKAEERRRRKNPVYGNILFHPESQKPHLSIFEKGKFDEERIQFLYVVGIKLSNKNSTISISTQLKISIIS